MEATLKETVDKLTTPGKGILAADESPGTLGKRFANTKEVQHLVNEEETRRAYREILVTSNLGEHIAGVILHEETLVQKTGNGEAFREVLEAKGVLAGVKVDQGLQVIDQATGETETKGLSTLGERCRKYREQGARFAKWRAALKIGENLPSERATQINALQLAKYARICQEAGLVPMVEPEILINGDHTAEKAKEVSIAVLQSVFAALQQEGVQLQHCLLKPQMVVAGSECETRSTREAIARDTLEVMSACVPESVPGIMFLSGGQTEEQATENLNLINVLAKSRSPRPPWLLSFSYGRALQASVLQLWGGRGENAAKAGRQLERIAEVNGKATLGEYAPPHPSLIVGDTLVENFRGHSGTR